MNRVLEIPLGQDELRSLNSVSVSQGCIFHRNVRSQMFATLVLGDGARSSIQETSPMD